MSKFSRSHLIVFLVLVLALTAITAVAGADSPTARKGGGQVSVVDIEFLDMVTFETGYMFADTEVGGLSGITYDAYRGVYYALSDDRSEENPSRYYTVDIDYNDSGLSVTFVDVTFMRDKAGNLYGFRAIDPESIELVRPGYNFISTEGDDVDPPIDPFVNRYNPVGKQTRALPIPGKFLYSVDDGNQVRDNLGFESLTSTPNRRYIYAATENALLNDGPISTLETTSPSRFLEIDLRRKQPGREFVYCVDPIPQAPIPPEEFADHGLVEIQALDNVGTFLTMERSFAVGVGNTILLFETSTHGADDVSDTIALDLSGCPEPEDNIVPMDKQLIVNLEDLGVDPDNVEGMSFGPKLADGRSLLILVSDNNFRASQITQFIALAVELD